MQSIAFDASKKIGIMQTSSDFKSNHWNAVAWSTDWTNVNPALILCHYSPTFSVGQFEKDWNIVHIGGIQVNFWMYSLDPPIELMWIHLNPSPLQSDAFDAWKKTEAMYNIDRSAVKILECQRLIERDWINVNPDKPNVRFVAKRILRYVKMRFPVARLASFHRCSLVSHEGGREKWIR